MSEQILPPAHSPNSPVAGGAEADLEPQPSEPTITMVIVQLDRIRIKKAASPLVPHVWEGARHSLTDAQLEAWKIAHPVIVRKAGDFYELQSGGDRVERARLLGLATIACYIAEPRSDASRGSKHMDSVVLPLLHLQTHLNQELLFREMRSPRAPFVGVKGSVEDLVEVTGLSHRTVRRRIKKAPHE